MGEWEGRRTLNTWGGGDFLKRKYEKNESPVWGHRTPTLNSLVKDKDEKLDCTEEIAREAGENLVI